MWGGRQAGPVRMPCLPRAVLPLPGRRQRGRMQARAAPGGACSCVGVSGRALSRAAACRTAAAARRGARRRAGLRAGACGGVEACQWSLERVRRQVVSLERSHVPLGMGGKGGLLILPASVRVRARHCTCSIALLGRTGAIAGLCAQPSCGHGCHLAVAHGGFTIAGCCAAPCIALRAEARQSKHALGALCSLARLRAAAESMCVCRREQHCGCAAVLLLCGAEGLCSGLHAAAGGTPCAVAVCSGAGAPGGPAPLAWAGPRHIAVTSCTGGGTREVAAGVCQHVWRHRMPRA